MTTRGAARSPRPKPLTDSADDDSGATLRNASLTSSIKHQTPPSLQFCDRSSSITIHVDMSLKSGSNTAYVVQYNDESDTPTSPVIKKSCHDAAGCFDAVDVELRRRKTGTLQVDTICSARDPASSKGPGPANEHQVASHTKSSTHPTICLQAKGSLR